MEAYIEEMNGDLFIPNDEGEADRGNEAYEVEILENHDGRVVTDRAILINMANQIVDQNITVDVRIRNVILACRFGAYKLGLLRPNADPATLNCRYNEATSRNVVDADLVAPLPNWVDFAILSAFAPQMSNLVCFCNYIFRWRGHHYKAEYLEGIIIKWRKNTNAPANLINPNEFAYILTYGFHAIPPMVLDGFHGDCCANNRICRPFILRYHVPCAGTAAYFAMYAGVTEARLIFPDAINRVNALVDELRALCVRLRRERWLGGINRSFYGAGAIDLDEGKFSAIASIIAGMHTAEDHGTPLGQSQSLNRIAGQAPISRAIIQSVTSGIYIKCANGDTQNELGDKALRSIVFTNRRQIEDNAE